MVALAAGVDGCLDFSLAALWGKWGGGGLVSQCDFPTSFWERRVQGKQPGACTAH